MRELVASVDQWLLGTALGVQDFFVLAWRTFRFSFSRPFYARDLLRQMDRIGVGSLPPLLLTGMFTGMVIALQTEQQLRLIGAQALIGNLVGISLIQEAGPVLAALMVAGRVASGIAAELAAMRISEQMDALQTFGTDPIRKLVVPRVLAGVLMLPILTIITVGIGLAGGLLVSVVKGVATPDVYMKGIMDALARKDFLFGFFPSMALNPIVKPMVFGAIITLSGSYFGFYATGGGEGVGRAATRAMVLSFVLILISDFFLTKILFLFYNIARYHAPRKRGDYGNVG